MKDFDREIVYRNVVDLIPYAMNSRTHSEQQVNQIASSIHEFGFTNPILVDADFGVIAGHCRILAAKRLNIDRVPTIDLSHLSDAQKRAYIIADNKLALNAGWDNDLLAVEFAELSNDGFDLLLTGFSASEINPNDDKFDGDTINDPDDGSCFARVSNGQVWTLGRHKLMCGDSSE